MPCWWRRWWYPIHLPRWRLRILDKHGKLKLKTLYLDVNVLNFNNKKAISIYASFIIDHPRLPWWNRIPNNSSHYIIIETHLKLFIPSVFIFSVTCKWITLFYNSYVEFTLLGLGYWVHKCLMSFCEWRRDKTSRLRSNMANSDEKMILSVFTWLWECVRIVRILIIWAILSIYQSILVDTNQNWKPLIFVYRLLCKCYDQTTRRIPLSPFPLSIECPWSNPLQHCPT